MAAYCRLSKEDGENRVSESIENQMKLIQEYVQKAKDLEIVGVYIDDGYSGLSFANRPQFQKMMADIYQGSIQGVITKDISRLGREHIETSNYLERVFPALNIRYIAVLDGVDSAFHRNEELAQFKTLFNDMYSRDISKKIRGSLSARKKQGQLMSAFAPYGYKKNPLDKHQLLIDEEAAVVVRRIYALYLSGYALSSIARKLNEEGILTPSEYKRSVQGLNYANAKEKAGGRGWGYPTVQAILKNRVYTGAMVQHKSEKISYKLEKYRYIPEEQQYIVEGTHEAVISKEVFGKVQEMMKKRTRTPGFCREPQKVNPYAGILICGDCGCNLQRVTCRNGYECGSYHKKGNHVCVSHFVKKEVLDAVIAEEVQRQMQAALQGCEREEILRLSEDGKKSKNRCSRTDQRINELQEKRSRIWNYKKRLYEDSVDGVLNQEEYRAYRAEYQQQIEEIEAEILQREKEKTEVAKAEEDCKSWLEKAVTEGVLTEIRRELVTEFLEKIIVNRDRSIELVFRYQSPYDFP